jgi:hypothetical protein
MTNVMRMDGRFMKGCGTDRGLLRPPHAGTDDIPDVDDLDLEHRWHSAGCSVDVIALRNCLKISSGAVYFAFHASAENNRSNGAAGALDTGDVVVFS